MNLFCAPKSAFKVYSITCHAEISALKRAGASGHRQISSTWEGSFLSGRERRVSEEEQFGDPV